MGKPREFTTMPVRAIADSRLSALDLRCLAVISLHDGMSHMKGSGPGCYAKSATLAELVRTDISNFSKALNRLIKFGYVIREPQQGDKRRFTHRVLFGDNDSWRNDQHYSAGDDAGIVGQTANNRSEMVGETANQTPKVVGDAGYLSDGNSSQNSSHYISLNEEIDFEESNEINSVETAQLAFREPRIEGEMAGDIVSKERRKDGAEAPAASKVSILNQLPRNFVRLPMSAQLGRFEDAFAKIDRNADALDSRERQKWQDWLFAMSDEFSGESVGRWAMRLLVEMELS